MDKKSFEERRDEAANQRNKAAKEIKYTFEKLFSLLDPRTTRRRE